MPTFSIKLVGANELVAKYGDRVQGGLRTATRAIGELIRDAIAKYPGPVHEPFHWRSESERRGYFAHRFAKGLGLPYVRNSDPESQRLGASWAVSTQGPFGAKVGTRVSYAPDVQGAANQHPGHKATGWITDKQAVEKVHKSGDIARILRDAIRHALGR